MPSRDELYAFINTAGGRFHDVKLFMLGGCRDAGDGARVAALNAEIRRLGIEVVRIRGLCPAHIAIFG